MAGDREQLRRTFDSAAARYADARPTYPAGLLDALVDAAGLAPGARLLEVGCGPGTATLPLAERGFVITALELGAALAAEARRRLAGQRDVSVVHTAFEDWPGPAHAFDLLYAATAWHWVDPGLRYRRAHELLVPGGHLAFWSATHAFPPGGDPFFVEIQDVYEEIGEGLAPGEGFPTVDELPELTDEVEASGLFDVVLVRHVGWTTTYTAEAYLALLDTFSGHIAMEPARRDHLYAEIRRRIAARPSGTVERGWGAVLHVARAR